MLYSEGISQVQAFPTGNDPAICQKFAFARWKSTYQDKAHCIYINGRFAGLNANRGSGEMIVPIVLYRGIAERIEVFACDSHEPPIEIESDYTDGMVELRFVIEQSLSADTTAQIYCDNGSGIVDFDLPLNSRPVAIWPGGRGKSGFALNKFGLGDFGWDGACAGGFGIGGFGSGCFGFGVCEFVRQSPPLDAGRYIFVVRLTDKSGNYSDVEFSPVIVISPAVPAKRLTVKSYDRIIDKLILKID